MINFLTATADATASMTSTIIMMVMMLAIFYFLLIRPENKRKKEQEEMRAAIKKGDEVVTIGAVIGTVVDVKEKTIVLETGADQVRIEFEKWAISTNYTADKAAKEKAKKEQEAKAKAKAAKNSGK